jgi:hypothetical protein
MTRQRRGGWVGRLGILGLAAALWSGGPAAADDSPALRRFALVMGSNDGGPDRVRLRYAGTDAAAMAAVLQDVGGVAPSDLLLVPEVRRADVLDAFRRLEAAVGAARAEATRLEVVVYYSGHSDPTGLLPGGERLDWRDLRLAIGRLPADVRVTVLDACSSGAVLRTKGGAFRPAFLADEGTAVTGEAVLASSTADEASQESDLIGASFFTHHLVAGLRGAADADLDGLVTLSEAYAYAFRETREATAATLAGPQSPTFALDLQGQGDFIVTDLRRATSRVQVDALLDGSLTLRRPDGRPLLVVDKVPGEPMTLSVPPGRYDALLRSGPDAWAARIDVPDASVARLAQGDFSRAAVSATRLRGGPTLGDAEPVVAQAPPQPPPTRTLRGSAQLFGRPRAAGFRVEGPQFGLIHARAHSVAGSQTSMFTAATAGPLRGAQVSLLGGRVGELHGAQLSFLGVVSAGDVVGMQGGMLFSSAAGRLQGAQLSLGVNVVRGASPAGSFGTQLAGLGNVATGSRTGAQLGALFNLQGHHFRGAQLGAGVNRVGGRLTGVQLGGLVQVVGEGMDGAQVALGFNRARVVRGAQTGLVNSAGEVRGAQAGLINVAGRVRGTQLGLVNVADDVEGESVGLLSFVRTGYHVVELGTDDLTPLTLAVKFGSKHLYTGLHIGLDPVGGAAMSLGGLFGVHAPLFDDRGFVDLEAGVRTTELQTARTDNLLSGLIITGRILAGGRIVGPFGVYAGPAFHAVLPLAGADVPKQSFLPGFSLGGPVVGHVGYQVGFRVTF